MTTGTGRAATGERPKSKKPAGRAAMSAEEGTQPKGDTSAKGSKARSHSARRPGDRDKPSLAKVLGHPMRVHILAAAHPGPTSPSDIARRFDEPLPRISYHFRVLKKHEAIELVGEEKVRGAVKHLYAGTKRAIYTQADWLQLPESVQAGLAGAGLRDFSDITVAAIQSGSFSERDFVFDWKEVTLDEKGWLAMLKVQKLAIQKIASLEEESEARMVATGEKPVNTVTGLFGFLAPPMRSLDSDSDSAEP